MKLAPIALFVYNRPDHIIQVIDALQCNELAKKSELYIYSDAGKNPDDDLQVEIVRKYLRMIKGFQIVRIIERKENYGLARSIISGVTDIVNKHGQIIVLEDDLVTSPYFLQYMNDALDIYENESEVISIHGYIYPVKVKLPETFFIKGADCWGWATWKRGWDLFNPDGQELMKTLKEQRLQKEFNFNGSCDYIHMLKDQIISLSFL